MGLVCCACKHIIINQICPATVGGVHLVRVNEQANQLAALGKTPDALPLARLILDWLEIDQIAKARVYLRELLAPRSATPDAREEKEK